MFDFFSGSHILILLGVLLVVVGPKDLPRLMRMVGQWAGKARNMANEFKKSFDDMARQEELDKLRQELDALRQTDLDAAVLSQKVAEADLPVEEGAAPRSGEFQVTETPVAPASGPESSNQPPAQPAGVGSPAP